MSIVYIGLGGLPGLLMFLLALLSLGLVGVTVYRIFRKKDERDRWLLTLSMAQGFGFFIGLQALLTLGRIVSPSWMRQAEAVVERALHVEPVFQYLVALGVFLLVNKRRHGG